MNANEQKLKEVFLNNREAQHSIRRFIQTCRGLGLKCSQQRATKTYNSLAAEYGVDITTRKPRRRALKPRKSSHAQYSRWSRMKAGCLNPDNPNYDFIGAKGITLHPDFEDFTVWLEYVSSLEGFGEEGLGLWRIDTSKNYTYGNLKWADPKEVVSFRKRTVKYRGVSANPTNKKHPFMVSISHKGEAVYLGVFETALSAAQARDAYIDKHNLKLTKSIRKSND